MNLPSDSNWTSERTTIRSEDWGCKLCPRKGSGPKNSPHVSFECNGEELLGKEDNFCPNDNKEDIEEVARRLAEIGDKVYYSSNTMFARGLAWITNVFEHLIPDNFLHRRLTRMRLLDMEHAGIDELSKHKKAKIFARQLALIADVLDQEKGRFS